MPIMCGRLRKREVDLAFPETELRDTRQAEKQWYWWCRGDQVIGDRLVTFLVHFLF